MTANPATNYALPRDTVQRQATAAPEGPLLIQGGPGVGKTHTLTARAVTLIESGAQPQHVTCICYTNAAATLMADTIQAVCPNANGIYIGTIHMLASTLLRHGGAQTLGLSPSFSIWDHNQAHDLLEQLTSLDLPKDQKPPTNTELRAMLRWHSRNQTLHNTPPTPARRQQWVEWARAYSQQKVLQNAMDLDDLCPLAVSALEQSPNLRNQYRRSRTRHLLVDDCQDITPIQYRLLQLLTGPTNNIAIAADTNQTINQWRGASPRLVNRFVMDHSEATQVTLTINHRSSGRLNEAANAVTTHQDMNALQPANSRSLRPQGPQIQVIDCQGDNNAVTDLIVNTITHRVQEGQWRWEDIAIIYRNRQIAATLPTKLTNAKLPHQIVGDINNRQYDTAAVITAMLTLMVNPNDSRALKQAAATHTPEGWRPLNPHLLQQITKLAQDNQMDLIQAAGAVLPLGRPSTQLHQALSYTLRTHRLMLQLTEDQPDLTPLDLCHHIHQQLLYHASQDDQPHTLDMIQLLTRAEMCPRRPDEPLLQTVSRLLEHQRTAIYPQQQGRHNQDITSLSRGITLSTIHATKGRQWKIVWLLDASDHILSIQPPANSPDADIHHQDSQRLFYVAITRATDELYLCNPAQEPPPHSHQDQESQPTRYIAALPEESVEWSFPYA